MPDELLGICVVYLGGLNYFFSIDELCPVVSKVGTTDGRLHVQIAPFTRARSSTGDSQDDNDSYVRYERKDIDNAEEQVYEHMDHALQYRVHIDALSNLPRRARKFSHLYVRYSFFKAGATQTAHEAVPSHTGSDVRFSHERRFAIDVTDAFVKYIASASLTFEVFGCSQLD